MKPKFFAIITAILLLSSCSSGVTSNRFFTLNFYESEIIPSTTYIERGEVAAIEFYATDPFSGIEVLAAKVSDEDRLTVTIYELNTDYETTLKNGKKIESATFKDYESRDSLIMSFKTVPKGKYLLTFSTKSSAGICVASYAADMANGEVKFYLNGFEYTDGAFYAGIIFNGDRLNKNYFKNETSIPQTPSPEPAVTPTETPLDPENTENSEETPIPEIDY